MLRFSVFIMFSSTIIFCILISAVSSIPPPPPPPPKCINGDVLSYCYNNPCLKKYCVQQEHEPDCKMKDYCLPGCLCKEGYLRAQNGTCVPNDKCPTSIICGENEMYSRCINHACFKMNCSQPETSNLCKDHVFVGECVEGCMCKYTHLRADNGTCIPSNECPSPLAQETAASSDFNSLTKRSTNEDRSSNIKPSTCGVNEEVSKCSNGGCFQTYCTELGRPPLCRDLIEGGCITGCVCKSNYLRNANGTCVPIKECPQNEVCTEPNEYYDLCPPPCSIRECSFLDSQPICPPHPSIGDPGCYPSCLCKEGFYRNYNRDCVPREDCSKYCSGRNENYFPYPKTCGPQTCDSINDTKVLQSADTTCSGECRCYPGFVRNKHGECIAKENCGKCQGPNEHFGCKTSCDNVCEPNVTECTTANEWLCVDSCYCDEGFARDANNICIPIADCPKEK